MDKSSLTWHVCCQQCELCLGQHVASALILCPAHTVAPRVQRAQHAALLRAQLHAPPVGGGGWVGGWAGVSGQHSRGECKRIIFSFS
eukprot:364672-Chlamydomonas_euryale.AAC.4